jgi:hypothetical protein
MRQRGGASVVARHEPRDIANLNAGFYSSAPGDYFAVKLGLLTLMASGTRRFGGEVAAGVTLGPLTVQQDAPPGRAQFADEQVESYVVAESVALSHHAAETLLRLLLAHLNDRGCPWLEVAMLRGPRDFKRALEQIVGGPNRLTIRDMTDAFFLCDESSDPSSIANVRWERAKSVHLALIVAFAKRLLMEAPLYNAMKHGLAIDTTHGTMSLGIPGEDPAVTTEGHWVRVLDRERRDDEVVWFESAQLVEPRHYWLMTLAGTYMMNALWSVGRARCDRSTHIRPFVAAAELDVDELARFGSVSGFRGLTRVIGTERA